jgi:aspartyl aminopeptidase
MTNQTELNGTKERKKKLFNEQTRTRDKLSPEDTARVTAYAEGYRQFLNTCRTERKAVRFLVEMASQAGFVALARADRAARRLFQTFRDKVLAMAVLGTKPMTEGIRLIACHLDAPRLDLKPNPLYEDMGLALLKTHYYGGVKKYHWVARTLALVGTVVRLDGSQVDVEIGLSADDPVFTIPDLLPHLARKQMEQKASEFLPAENLNLILGSLPHEDKDADDRVKLAILELLHDKYGITEQDFISAEIQIVPAEPARDAGLDRGLIVGYGQDDRVCAYTSCTALLETQSPEHTSVVIFFDKEEIGSEGNTGAQSRFLETFLMDLLEMTGIDPSSRNLLKALVNSKALSADVTAAIDPTYAEVFEKRNNARLGHGINLTKYTGHGGKYMGSDANAEYVGWVRKLLTDHEVSWQAAASGKVDEGGGGTVAKFLAKSGLEIIDCGPPILGMHSPAEVSSKDDVWMCYRAFSVFLGS